MPIDYKQRIQRLLKIVTLMQGEPGWNAKRLALECQTSERNIYRDLRMLTGAGIPWSFDRETSGYKIRRDFFLPAVELTFEESLALVALAEHVAGEDQLPFTEPAAKAISKLRCNLPRIVQDELSKLEDRIAIRLTAVNPPEGMSDVYRTIRQALSSRKALRCSYDSLSKNGEASEVFLFKPYTLFFNQRAWYAIGYHGNRKAVRCLKLNRFTQCTLTEQAYVIPKSFSLQKHLGNAWRMIKGRDAYDVEIEFDSEFAETIADTRWHATQDTEDLPDGSMVFRCKVDGLDEIVWWVLSMGPHCRVIKPRELADRVKHLAEAMSKQYANK